MPEKYTHCQNCGKEKKEYWHRRYALCADCAREEQRQKATKKKYAVCENCGKPKPKPNYYPLCKSCGKRTLKWYDECIDCGKPKTNKRQKQSPRCVACSNKYNAAPTHTHYTHCIDCGEEKSRNPYPRCKPCSKKVLWQDSDYQEKQKAYRDDPEFIEKQSQAQLEVWSDPEYRELYGGLLAERNRAAAYPNREGRYALDFNEGLKEEIRERDGRRCQLCGKKRKKGGKKLHVHHINYDKLDGRVENLVALCNTCHVKTNWNRPYWIQVFTKYWKRQPKMDWQRKVVVM